MHWINRTYGTARRWSNNQRNLRSFALVIGLAIALWAGYLLWQGEESRGALWSVVLVIWLILYLTPVFRFVYILWVTITRFIGEIISSLILLILYFVVITPAALIKSLFSKQETVGWKASEPPGPMDRLY